MPKKVTKKPKYSVEPFDPETLVHQVLNIKGVNLPQTTAELLRAYYDAFLGQGFTTEQSFQLTLQWVRFYLGV